MRVLTARSSTPLFLASTTLLLAQDGGTPSYDQALGQLKAAVSDDTKEDETLKALAALLVANPVNAVREAIATMDTAKELAPYYAIVVGLSEASTKEALEPLVSNIRSNAMKMETRRDLVFSLQLNEYAAADEAIVSSSRMTG